MTKTETLTSGRSDGNNGMHAVRGTAIVCFAAVIIGDIVLLYPSLKNGLQKHMQLPIIMEIISWVILAYGIIWIWRHKKGWATLKSKLVVFGLFGLYVLYSVLLYSQFQAVYGGFFSQESVAGAMVAVRLVLVLIGITAGIPTIPKIDSREYSRRLREKALQQEANWAKESVKGARRDLQATVDKLRNSLTPEEMQALVEELRGCESDVKNKNDPDAVKPADSVSLNGVTTKDVHEGWGGGM